MGSCCSKSNTDSVLKQQSSLETGNEGEVPFFESGNRHHEHNVMVWIYVSIHCCSSTFVWVIWLLRRVRLGSHAIALLRLLQRTLVVKVEIWRLKLKLSIVTQSMSLLVFLITLALNSPVLSHYQARLLILSVLKFITKQRWKTRIYPSIICIYLYGSFITLR